MQLKSAKNLFLFIVKEQILQAKKKTKNNIFQRHINHKK